MDKWAPRPILVGLAWVLTAASLAWTVFFGESAAGRLLTGLATAGLGLLALSGTLARPTLTAADHGVVVRRLTRRQSWPWATLDVRVIRTRRLGRQTSLLCLDGLDADGVERFAVLGWLDLGTQPELVAAALRQQQP